MILQVLSSSSAGNCYLLCSDNEILIVEAGVKLSKVKQALNYDMSKIVGCIVSHSHGDHAGEIVDYTNAGINVLALKYVFDTKGITEHHRARIIEANKGYSLGSFKILAFPVAHDVPTLGFLISHPESGNILFVTDTFMCEYTFKNLNHILIEANYSDEILSNNIITGKRTSSMRKRLMFSHMEIKTTKNTLLSNDLSGVINIVLIHLSSENSNEKQFVEDISAATGKMVYAANKGLIIPINLMPY